MDKIKFLKDNFFLFKGLNNSEISTCLHFDGLSETEYAPKAIIQDHSCCEHIGIIVKGRALVKSDADGVIINKLTKNDVYGVAALFDAPSYTTVVQADNECSVITLNKSFIEKCIAFSHACAINYIELLAEKISFLNKKINAFTAKSAENKLYAYLLQLPRTDNVLELNTDMSTIAKMIGIGRATLYRAFEKLQEAGTITKSNKKIIFNEV